MMIPVGYMAKRVVARPDSIKSDQVKDIYSVSGCISEYFCDYIDYWQHNGYWLFDSPQVIQTLAQENGIDLSGTTLFYYEAYELQADVNEPVWQAFEAESAFATHVVTPDEKQLIGFDVVSFSGGTAPECSYLSCNHMAEKIAVNEHCLLASFEQAKALIDQKAFAGCEPGPCRIFAVYQVKNT